MNLGIHPERHTGCQGIGICSGGTVVKPLRFVDPGYCEMNKGCPRIFFGSTHTFNMIFSGHFYIYTTGQSDPYTGLYQRPALYLK